MEPKNENHTEDYSKFSGALSSLGIPLLNKYKKKILLALSAATFAYATSEVLKPKQDSDSALPLPSITKLKSDTDNYMGNGIPRNVNQSPLTLLFKSDFSYLKDKTNDHLLNLSLEETDVLNKSNNLQELREILNNPDKIAKVQKIIEFLMVQTAEDRNGNPRYSSEIENGACNLYVTDILDLLYYQRTDDLLSYRTDLEGNPITHPVEILKVDAGERTDFSYSSADTLLNMSRRNVDTGTMIDATEFTHEQHIEYLKEGYIFIIFLVNEKDDMASHIMLEFYAQQEDGAFVPAITQATTNRLAKILTKDSKVFIGDDSDEFGKRYPAVFAIKL